MEDKNNRLGYILYGSTITLIILTGFLVFGYIKYHKLQIAYATLTQNLNDTKASLEEKNTETGTLTATIEEIKQAFTLSEENGTELLNQLTEEKNKNDAFENQIGEISGTVGQLDKLSKMDPELLQKYSKIYFLNENYMPGLVVKIDSDFVFNTSKPEYIHKEVAPYLDNLLTDASDADIKLFIVSAYRSFDEQKSLKSTYSVQYGAGANTFSADQGYSEHQLGTTVDFTTKETGGALTAFEKTSAYTWLLKNAYKYGFVLSYPEQNTYYMFEPWHWRFVGKTLARDLHTDNKFFYDLGQREIDTYLIKLFN